MKNTEKLLIIKPPKKKLITGKTILDYLIITIAIFVSSVGIYFFCFSNNFSFGGVSGISLLLAEVIHIGWITPSLMTTGFNIILLIIGFIVLGKEFGVKTAYCTILLSLFLMIFPIFFPIGTEDSILPFTKGEQPILEVFFAILLTGGSSALLFNRKASSGGMDIVALIIKKKFGIESGKALMVCDSFVVMGAFLIFNIERGMLCLLGLMMKALVIDNIIESINRSKYFLIITTRLDPIKNFITNNLKTSATYWRCEGAYSSEGKYAIISILKPRQARLLRDHMKQQDPNAFMIVMNTSDIVGKGFKNLSE